MITTAAQLDSIASKPVVGVFLPRLRTLHSRKCRRPTAKGTNSVESKRTETPMWMSDTPWKIQQYLEDLYGLPSAFDLKVVEETKTEEKKQPSDYYVNFGKAIETIKDDFPRLFERDFDYSIFRDDLVFRDPVNTFQGIKVYKYMWLSLRWHGRILFKRVFVHIHSFWPRDEGTIRVRWSIHAIPRIPWETEGIFDGVSEYKLDSHGKIYEHAVDNVIFRDPPVLQLPVFFARLSRASRSRDPIPNAWCRTNCQGRFSWFWMYFILSMGMTLFKNGPENNQPVV